MMNLFHETEIIYLHFMLFVNTKIAHEVQMPLYRR